MLTKPLTKKTPKKNLSIENLESRLNLSTLTSIAASRWSQAAGVSGPFARQLSTYSNINVMKIASPAASNAASASSIASATATDLAEPMFGDTTVSSSSTTAVNLADVAYIANAKVDWSGGAPVIGWMGYSGVDVRYKLNVSTPGSYRLNLGVSSPSAGGVDVYVNGAYAASYSYSSSNSWFNYSTITQNINLAAGSNTISIVPKTWSAFNLNAVSLTPVTPTATAPATSTTTSTSTGTTLNLSTAGLTVGGQQYSSISGCKVDSGSSIVGYMTPGGYVEYKLNVASAGNYDIGVNTASPYAGSYTLSVNGSAAKSYNFSSNNSWFNFSRITNSVYLPAGTVTLRFSSNYGSLYNTENLLITAAGSTTTSPTYNVTPTPAPAPATAPTSSPISVSSQWMTSFNQLNIVGTAGNDSIYVTQAGNTINVTANGVTNSYYGPYGAMVIKSSGGNDSITVDSSVRLNTAVYGGSGNSTIRNATQGFATVVTVGAGYNNITGNGFNSAFWVNGSDTVNASAAESYAGAVHRVTSFWNGVSTSLAGQNLADPWGTGATTRVPNASFWGTGPTMADVNQGQVADCFLLGPLQGLAYSTPNALRQMAVDLGDGTYAVQFKRSGVTTFLRVDGDLPANGPYANGLNYNHSSNNSALWASIMEKAYAHFRTGANSYASLSWGWFGAVLADLGVRYTQFGAGDANTMFNTIANGLNAGKAVIIGTNAGVSAGAPLIGSHTYNVTSVWRDGGGTGWIQLRNTWGMDGAGWDGNAADGLVTMTMYQLQSNLQAGVVTA